MAAHPIVTPGRLLAALAAGLIAASPALSQQQQQTQPIPRSQRGAAAQPRQVRPVHRGESAQPRRFPAVQRGAAGQQRGPRALRGIRAPRSQPNRPGGVIIVDRGGTLLNRGVPMAVRTGRMGGNDAAFPITGLPQDRRVFVPSPPPDRRGRFLAFDNDDDDFRFFVDLGGGNVWISDDPVFAPAGYWQKRGPYRRYWFPQSAYFPGTTYVSSIPAGYRYRDYSLTQPVFVTDEGYIDASMSPTGPQYVPAPVAPPRELTATERAQRALLSNQPDAAVTILREHVRTNPDDAEAVRQLAVAMLEAGEPAQAVAVMAMAYDKDPTLASRPLAAPLVYSDPQALRRALNRAVTFANRVNTSSSWLLVATLMQAEGRLDAAKRMLDRATALGLDERIGAPMRQALGSS